MALIDSILGTVQINNSTEPIVAVCGTSLTIKQGWGTAEIVGAVAFGDTDAITRAVITAPSWSDANGVSCLVKSDVADELGPFKLYDCMFDVPIPVAPGDTIDMPRTSEPPANSQAYGLIWVEYTGCNATWTLAGSNMAAMVTRQWTADAQLVSNTDTAQTALNTLAASKMYQVCGLRSGGIAAATAGLVGPAFMIMHSGPGEFNGAQLILPLGKGIDVAGQDNIELAKAGMLTPQFRGGQAFNYRLYGFTAEQPQGEILFFASQP